MHGVPLTAHWRAQAEVDNLTKRIDLKRVVLAGNMKALLGTAVLYVVAQVRAQCALDRAEDAGAMVVAQACMRFGVCSVQGQAGRGVGCCGGAGACSVWGRRCGRGMRAAQVCVQCVWGLGSGRADDAGDAVAAGVRAGWVGREQGQAATVRSPAVQREDGLLCAAAAPADALLCERLLQACSLAGPLLLQRIVAGLQCTPNAATGKTCEPKSQLY